MSTAASDKRVILYDGTCGLCDRVVRAVLPRDAHDRFRYAALQGEYARRLLRAHGEDPDALDTFYVVVHPGTPSEALLDRGRAALAVLAGLGGIYALLAALLRLLPRPLLDAGYRVVARNRFRLFGRADACPLPRPEWRERFLA